MEADGDSPQLWSPPTTLHIPICRRTSPILNPVALILAIPILVLLIIFLILPPLLSHTNHQILKPSSVQKGWDSINIFLVLFAVLCAVFAKRNDAGEQKDLGAVTNVSEDNIRKSVASSKWLDFPNKAEYDKMRSSRSYPDLRQESLWGSESDGFKFFDDSEVNFHRQPEKCYHSERRNQKVETEAVAEPAPPPPTVNRRLSVHRGRNDEGKNENIAAPPPAPSLPPPPPEQEFHPLVEKGERLQRGKSGATKEISTAIASLHYGTQTQRKNKLKTRDIYESATQDSLPPSVLAPPSTPPPPPSKGLQSVLKKSSKSKRVHSVPTIAQPPPPPPPPPPNSFFANIFKTGSKSNHSQLSSASSQPPPPPPPPPYSIFNNIFSSDSKSKRCQISSSSSQPHPSPPTSSILNSPFENLTKSQRFKNSDTPFPPLPPQPPIETRPVYTGKPPKPPKSSTSSHNETHIIVPPSPLIPMPPPAPFRMPEMKFVPKGDFARERSTNSSRRRSPELEDVDVMSTESDGGQSTRPSISCPSPDVNTKADTFISRLRDGWRLEKLNSINERQNSISTSNRPRS